MYQPQKVDPLTLTRRTCKARRAGGRKDVSKRVKLSVGELGGEFGDEAVKLGA